MGVDFVQDEAVNNEAEGEVVVPNRAGMIVFNWAGQVLIISAISGKDIWVLPKGHIEKDESSLECAEREVLEETGILAEASMSAPVCISEYQYAGEDVIIEWWVGIGKSKAIFEDNYNESDFRTVKWVPFHLALEMLSFGSQRNALRQALCLPVVDNDYRHTKTSEKELDNFPGEK